MKTIRIIRPSSRESGNLLTEKIESIERLGYNVLYDEILPDPSWPYASSTIETRLKSLENALFEESTDIIMCARGGYGASDLIAALNWDKLSEIKEKPIVGFSDISALHSAFYKKLGWRGIHAPMPATALLIECRYYRS